MAKCIAVFCFALLCFATVTVDTAKQRLPKGNPRFRLTGNEGELGEFPYSVGLKTKGSTSPPTCGGAIIGPRHVITEAWCVDIIPNMIVMAGCEDYYGKCTEYDSSALIYHPEIGEIGVNDLAIVVTSEDIVFTDLVQPIAVGTSFVEAATAANITGWTSWSVSELAWTEVEVVSQEDCSRNWSEATEGSLCTTPGSAIGWGDWGNPLVVDGELVGLPVNSDFSSTLHMRLSNYTEWIDSVLNEY